MPSVRIDDPIARPTSSTSSDRRMRPTRAGSGRSPPARQPGRSGTPRVPGPGCPAGSRAAAVPAHPTATARARSGRPGACRTRASGGRCRAPSHPRTGSRSSSRRPSGRRVRLLIHPEADELRLLLLERHLLEEALDARGESGAGCGSEHVRLFLWGLRRHRQPLTAPVSPPTMRRSKRLRRSGRGSSTAR